MAKKSVKLTKEHKSPKGGLTKAGGNMLKKVMKSVAKTIYKIRGKEQKFEDNELWSKWSKAFYTAYASYNPDQFDEFELVYRGTKDTLRNVNSKSKQPVKKTDNVPNIVYELIESEVNTATPEANVKSKKPGFEDQAKMIQEKIMSDLSEMRIENISDINERNTYMHGISAVLLNWNINKGAHEYMGEKELINYHPKQVIPQPNVFDTDDMDYMFLMGARTKSSIEEQYGVNVESESEQYPEVNQVEDKGDNRTNTNEIVTEIVCFYKDKDGDICKFVWAGTTPLENKPKYFYPRVEECKECGTENAQGEKECQNCGSKKLSTKVIMEETIEEDMELSPIVYPKKKKVLKQSADGKPYVDESIEQVVIQRIIPAGTKVPIFAPKMLPVVIRRNIPLNFSFRGRSDIETIRDQQEAIKKSWSKAQEKIMQGGGIIAMPQNLNKQPSDDVYQVWKGNVQDLAAIKVIDFQMDISQNIEFADANYMKAKSVLGITDSYQGKYDPSANSGKAKEIQVEQSAGRLQSKIKNKFTFYSDLFKLMFYYDICFTKESRPYLSSNMRGDEEYKEFNKYELLFQDATGEFYFNVDFIFKAEIGSSLPHDKTFLYEQAIMMYDKQAIDSEQLLEILSTLDFPIANRILEQKKAENEEVTQTQEVLTALQGMDPAQRETFLQIPLEEQMSILEEMKGGVNSALPEV